MDQLRLQPRTTRSIRITDSLVPVEVRRSIHVRVKEVVSVRELALSDDKVRNAVAINIRYRRTVELGKYHSSSVLRVVVIHHHVFYERDLAAWRTLLLEPRETETVRLKLCHDIVQSVTVHVINTDRRTAGPDPSPASERLRVVLPGLLLGTSGRLLPPTVCPHNVLPTIAIDISHT